MPDKALKAGSGIFIVWALIEKPIINNKRVVIFFMRNSFTKNKKI